jgi:hypothetical protein
MRLFRTSALWAAVAAAVGAFVLLGYFVDFEFIQNIRLLFMQWAALLAAAALLVGLANLVQVHWRKLSLTEEGWIYSALLILAFLVTLVLSLAFGPDDDVSLFIFKYFQFPIEAGLMALLSVTLLVAGFRLVTRRRDAFGLLFLATALLVMIGTGPALIGTQGPITVNLSNLRNWIAQVWSAGGARGIALGVALGATTTGLRVLLGADRPYGS